MCCGGKMSPDNAPYKILIVYFAVFVFVFILFGFGDPTLARRTRW